MTSLRFIINVIVIVYVSKTIFQSFPQVKWIGKGRRSFVCVTLSTEEKRDEENKSPIRKINKYLRILTAIQFIQFFVSANQIHIVSRPLNESDVLATAAAAAAMSAATNWPWFNIQGRHLTRQMRNKSIEPIQLYKLVCDVYSNADIDFISIARFHFNRPISIYEYYKLNLKAPPTLAKLKNAQPKAPTVAESNWFRSKLIFQHLALIRAGIKNRLLRCPYQIPWIQNTI